MGLWCRRSRSCWHKRGGHGPEEIGIRAGRGEGQTHAARCFDDAGGDFQQPQSEGVELGSGQIARGWNGVADGEHQPIGPRMQDEPDLIGERRSAGGAVGSELALVQLDEIFRLSVRARSRGCRTAIRASHARDW